MRRLANGHLVEDYVKNLLAAGGTTLLIGVRQRAEETFLISTDKTVCERSQWLVEEIEKQLTREHDKICNYKDLN